MVNRPMCGKTAPALMRGRLEYESDSVGHVPLIATLYLTRTGLLEPLGQSQVLSYLRGLSADFAPTVISCERDADLADVIQLARVEQICAEHGIRWVRLRYRRRPRLLASMLNLGSLVLSAWREARRTGARLIHARGYIPAAAAWAVSGVTGIPFVFDMRSLWPEELITSHRLRRGSFLHRVIVRAEGRLLARADMVVSLTRSGMRYIEETHPGRLTLDRVRIIPTCTDLDRFRPAAERGAPPLIGCHGSLLNGWFRVDLLAAMLSRIAARLPEARFQIITREDQGLVRQTLAKLVAGAGQAADGPASGTSLMDRLQITSARPEEIHSHLQAHHLSIFFYANATSELGRSPTRMGEALGCGVPVLVNAGVGDVEEVVRGRRVGICLQGDDEAELEQAAAEAVALIADPTISGRCRVAAEDLYALDAGVGAYRAIYVHLLESRE